MCYSIDDKVAVISINKTNIKVNLFKLSLIKVLYRNLIQSSIKFINYNFTKNNKTK